VVGFFATRALAHGNEELRRRQARAWFAEAQRASRDGQLESAIDRFRRAVLKDPSERQYRLGLAEALVAGGREGEAERALLALRNAQPEDPVTNLLLARLQRGHAPDVARRYYQTALAGLWRPAQADERRRVRLELVEFLLTHGEHGRALSELLLLTPNLPSDAPLQTRIGRMYLRAGDPRLAQQHFAAALRLQAGNADALSGAGEAAFELGDYGRAVRYLKAAPGEDSRIAELREVARLVVDLDPLAPRLGTAERRRRLRAMLQHAQERLDACIDAPASQPAAALPQLRDQVRQLLSALEAPARRDLRDVVDDGIDLAFRVGRELGRGCATAAPLERALLLLGRRYGFGDQ
jgi:tetratricopeptide (TPR) repeat protein